jgi:SPP1 family predicted phage head-tail adaptor
MSGRTVKVDFEKINAGMLRNRITIQSPTHTTDAIGGSSTSWGTFTTVWGMVLPYRGNEKLFAEQPRSQVAHMVVIRYLDGLTDDMRLQFTVGTETKTLQIKAITTPKNQYKDFMQLFCSEGEAS